MNTQEQRGSTRHDPAGLRACRLTALKDLVGKSVYDVPSKDVAASIIRDAFIIAAPEPETPSEQPQDQTPHPEH